MAFVPLTAPVPCYIGCQSDCSFIAIAERLEINDVCRDDDCRFDQVAFGVGNTDRSFKILLEIEMIVGR